MRVPPWGGGDCSLTSLGRKREPSKCDLTVYEEGRKKAERRGKRKEGKIPLDRKTGGKED